MYLKIILLILLFLPVTLSAQELTYNTISTEDGLPSVEIHCVLQDSQGYIWIGTKNGLCRWDSKNFEYFTIADGLPNNEVLFLYGDSVGRIWISSFSQELCYFFNGQIHNGRNTPFLNKIKNQRGGHLIVQNDELYYISDDIKLNKLNLLTQKLTTVSRIITAAAYFIPYKGKIWAIQDARDKEIFSTGNARTLIVNKDTSYYSTYYFLPGIITTAVDFKNKQYYFQHGVDTPFYHAKYKNKDFQIALYNNGKILEVYRNVIVQKKDGYRIKNDNPLNRPQIFVISGNLIMRTTRGLLFCSQTPILEYEHNQEIDNGAMFIFKYKKEIYAVNNKYQLINIAKQKKVNQLKGNAINLYNLLSFDRKFYLATSFDIYHFADPNEKMNAFSSDIHRGNFKYITPSKKADYFFTANGVQTGIFLINFKTKFYDTLLTDKQVSVYSVFEDSRSRLWYSTADKVYYTNEYYNRIRNSKELILDNTRPLFCKNIQEDNKGNLFFATNGGVFVYDGKYKYRISQSNLLSDNECNKVVIDTIRNSFWVATKNGLNHVGYFRENGMLKFRALSKFFATDGLRSDNINDILLDSNKLYIATDRGVNILDNVNYRPDTINIPIYLKLKAVNAIASKSYDTIKTIELKHNQNNLTIGFSALYFLRRDRLKIKAYLYRNNNLVSQNEITADKIDYYSLNEGDYKLVLYAYDQDYRYNNGRSIPFAFTIHPPYYKTWWFIVGSSLLVIIVSTSLLLWNLNRRKKRAIRQAELQAKLNESTLKSLQSQMNPHFVFNSLNTIQSFITEKNEEGAIDYLSDFSGLMREILEQSVHTFISLENEIQFLQHYIQLEMTRFKNSFDAVWNIDLEEDDLTDIYIPTMLIQPILENAVKHGVSNLDDLKGHLDITLDLVNGNLLRVVVKNNGRAVEDKKFSGNSIAVQTIKDRLHIYTKNKVKGEYHLEVSGNGATATITIPI